MDGVLVIDKPSGPTSHDVVARVRRALRAARIGHTGTLDPIATGVLPLVVGRATRLAQFITPGRKTYRASIRLGAATATYDAAGAVLPPSDTVVLPDAAAIEAALNRFRGTFLQVPPPYSAKKIAGVRAYDLARSAQTVTPRPVAVTVHELRRLDTQGTRLELELTSSPGFYVRSLAHELGEVLGCGAHLEALCRTASGGFTLADALPLDVVEQRPDDARGRIVPLERLLLSMPAIVLSDTGLARACHGNTLTGKDLAGAAGAPLAAPGTQVRLTGADGRLVGIGIAAAGGGSLRPLVVLV
jgi:tRNA pseudouridine55 synthase